MGEMAVLTITWLLLTLAHSSDQLTQIASGDGGNPVLVFQNMAPETWQPTGQQVWHHYLGNPVLTPEADYELWAGEGNLYAPAILRREGQYWLFYGAQDPAGHDQIHLAFSDNGLHWQRYPHNPIIEAGNANHVNDPTVVEVDGTLYLYYSLAPTAEFDTIHLATSSDGLRWEPQGEVLLPGPLGTWDSLKVGRPSVRHDAEGFTLWFDGTEADPEHPDRVRPGTGRHVGVSFSTDGHRFEKHPQPIYQHAGAVDVGKIGNDYVMLMEGGDGTQWAFGPSPTQMSPAGLLLNRSGAIYDRYGQVTPMLLIENGRWTAIYYGAAQGLPEPGPANWNRNRIGVAFPQKKVALTSLDGEPIPVETRALDRTSLQLTSLSGPLPESLRVRILDVDGTTILTESTLDDVQGGDVYRW